MLVLDFCCGVEKTIILYIAYEHVHMAFGKSICQFPLDYHAGKVSVY